MQTGDQDWIERKALQSKGRPKLIGKQMGMDYTNAGTVTLQPTPQQPKGRRRPGATGSKGGAKRNFDRRPGKGKQKARQALLQKILMYRQS
jgi:hypothetical protein